ncbi:argininosuccinate synthase [Thermospira aquatica]|uniref:Argininosuccinate synthase n=1 Tax=Thermospira aquatica TaxID=2828656 RepID=A0AAX3BBC3_9SPIR|nr:argininosuccinate synthase [Thermospira aquatica]URA09484.1 argininosuccinate synthase [Thermospira aquatica]
MKIVLAYSGGLDTSVILAWLKEQYNAEIIAYVADVGQQEDWAVIKEKALRTGASKVYVEDLKREFVEEAVFPAIKANATYEYKYLLGTSLARPIIAKKQVEIALKEGADAVAHGATGKGNDQVRFELTYRALAPHLKIIAPWKEDNFFTSRSDLIDFAEKHGIPVPVTKSKPYSMDPNLYHISYEGGVLEDITRSYDSSMFLMGKDPFELDDQVEMVSVSFEKGIPVALNGKRMDPVKLLQEANTIAGRHGIGIVDIVENRLVGMKSRGVYETPGGTLLIEAHKALESITLERDTMHYKQMVEIKFAEMIYYGQWFHPLRVALQSFIDSTQEVVSGTVELKLYRGNCVVVGRASEQSLYDTNLSTFEAGSNYDQKDAKGFIKLFGLPMEVFARKNPWFKK